MQEAHTTPPTVTTTATGTVPPTQAPTVSFSPHESQKRQSLLKIYDTLISKEHLNIQISCLETIFKILNNILTYPREEKYRQIRFSSRTLQTKVVNTRGGLPFLFEIGFQKKVIEFQEFLVFDPSRDPEWQSILTIARDLISEKKAHLEEQRTSAERRAKLLAEEEKLYKQTILQQIEDDKLTRKLRSLTSHKK
jgi:hypothetical protein